MFQILKKRLILTLLVDPPFFCNSRNFKLQKMVDCETVIQHLDLRAIDELVLLNVGGCDKFEDFLSIIKQISKKCFIPISAGGGIRELDDVQRLLDCGADKVVINTASMRIFELSRRFGSQCIVVSVDVKVDKDNKYWVYRNGLRMPYEVVSWIKEMEINGAGEIYLTSIDRDGRGIGYDTNLLFKVCRQVSIPVIASGGVGEFSHLADGIHNGADAVSLANLFLFIGTNLINAKKVMSGSGVDCPLWNFSDDDGK